MGEESVLEKETNKKPFCKNPKIYGYGNNCNLSIFNDKNTSSCPFYIETEGPIKGCSYNKSQDYSNK